MSDLTKALATVISASLLAVSTLAVHGQSPFTVSPRVSVANGETVLRVAFSVPTNHLLYADKLSIQLAQDTSAVEFRMPGPAAIRDKFSGHEKKAFTNSFEATRSLSGGIPKALTLQVHFQGCDDANCYFPEEKTYTISPNATVTEVEAAGDQPVAVAPAEWRTLATGFAVGGSGSGYLTESAFLSFLERARSGRTDAATPTRGGFWGLVLTAALIVLGGVALNLTPCILPMIPINLAIIGAGAQAGSKRRGFALGAAYAAGMAIAYGVLGLVVVLTGSKFGTLNSSPWFNVGIASVFLVLALGMFDLISIDFSRFQGLSGNGAWAANSKFILAYSMGTVAALLAGACVAPVVISVLVQATALHGQGVALGLLLPFLLGVGMGLPWPFAGAGLSFLPKPGKWMVRVKYGFGALIVCFAFYYGHLAFGLFRTQASLVAQAAGDPNATDAANLFSEQLSAALGQSRTDGRPVFIDFWASWCKNCSAMEHTTFAAAAVKERLRGFHAVRLQAEQPNKPPAREILNYFHVLGLPSYVVLLPNPPMPSEARQGSAMTAAGR